MQFGKYQLVCKLATGGMAELFLAKAAGPMGFEKTLVLKRILPQLADDPAFLEMFLNEARVVARLEHPNIVQIFDFGQAEGSWFLAMEYIDGPNLRILSKRAQAGGVELAPALCAKIVSLASEGLAFAHDALDPVTGEPLGLVHRDISPDNLLVSRQGAVKVVDFGVAKLAGQLHRTQTGVLKGKVAYMPPEQFRGEVLDRRADVYALGIVLYELLTGQRPFQASTEASIMRAVLFDPLVPLRTRRPELPEALGQILDRALAKEREERYPDCHALHEDLERFVLSMGESVGARQIAQLVTRVAGDSGLFITSGSQSEPRRSKPTGSNLPVVVPYATPTGSKALNPAPPGSTPPAEEMTEELDVLVPTPPSVAQQAPPAAVEPPALSGRRWPVWAAAMVLSALVGAGGFVLLYPRPAPEPPPSTPASTGVPQPVAMAALADTAEAQPPASTEPPPVVPVQAEPVQAELAAVEPVRPPKPAPRRMGRLDIRVRPYATVVLDGKEIGQTPLAPLRLAAGPHTLRLINTRLGKDVTVSVEVKPSGVTTFKYNLAKP